MEREDQAKRVTREQADQLEQEFATGRNRLIYLWGHIAAVNDGLFPLLGLGPKLYPEIQCSITNPGRVAVIIYSAEQLKQAWSHINEKLLATGYLLSRFQGENRQRAPRSLMIEVAFVNDLRPVPYAQGPPG